MYSRMIQYFNTIAIPVRSVVQEEELEGVIVEDMNIDDVALNPLGRIITPSY